MCTVSVSLSSGGDGLEEGDDLEEGVTYIVNVRAANRYGQSEVSGNSGPFSIDSNAGKDICTTCNGIFVKRFTFIYSQAH